LCSSEKSASVEDAAIVFADDENPSLTLEKRVQRLETLARNGPRANPRPKRPTKRALLEEIKKTVDELSKEIKQSTAPSAQKPVEKTAGRGITPRRTRGPPRIGSKLVLRTYDRLSQLDQNFRLIRPIADPI